jgi:hypothetical protein
MCRFFVLALLVLAMVPTTGRAADVTPLYPDAATFAFRIDVKGITTSPLGKKVIGTDKPFDATRKLLKVLFPADAMPFTDAALKPLETVANKLERVTVVGDLDGRGPPPIAVFLEGDIDEADYIKAAEGLAKAENKEFTTEKLGDRKLLIVGSGNTTAYGLRVSKSVFVIATSRELIDEVLDKHAGKKKANVQKSLAEWIKKAKPAETPIWLAVGEMKLLEGIKGGVATITLKDDADFRLEVACDKEDLAKTLTNALEFGVKYLTESERPYAKVWKAAGITVKQDGTTVTATGSIPGKVLAEEYARQK